jgi:ribosomal protein S18 acetylase RimI-like enzyme
VDLAGDVVLVDSGLPCDTFNFICRARLTISSARPRIQEALEFFRASGHPYSWWLGPGATPRELGDLLEQAGLVAAETEQAMSLDLRTLRGPLPRPADLIVRRVRTVPELQEYARLSASNWSPPDPHVLRYFDLASEALLHPDARQVLFLGVLDGQTVATTEVTLGGGVAGLYNIATLPAVRRRGIGTAMTLDALRFAQDAGFETAILQAAPEGISLYTRLRFTSFGGITEYKPRPR